MSDCPATSTPTPDDTATAPPPGYRQALRWRAHLHPRRLMVCTISPLSHSISNPVQVDASRTHGLIQSVSRHARFMYRDSALSLTMVSERLSSCRSSLSDEKTE